MKGGGNIKIEIRLDYDNWPNVKVNSEKWNFLKVCFILVCLLVCMCTVCAWCLQKLEDIRPPATRVIND